ncbi:hypothetical protein [Cytobacillus praedii]|nr:hypothetical protein [Cytobacillus praedii]
MLRVVLMEEEHQEKSKTYGVVQYSSIVRVYLGMRLSIFWAI